MVSYCEKEKELLACFVNFTIQQIPRSQNTHADALAKLASTRDAEFLDVIPVEYLEQPSISSQEIFATELFTPSWMDPILDFLRQGKLPGDRNEAHTIRRRAARYTIFDGKLYKKGFSSPLLLCVDRDQASYILTEIHEGICGNHAGGRSLSMKALRQGYYWPTFASVTNANVLLLCLMLRQKCSPR